MIPIEHPGSLRTATLMVYLSGEAVTLAPELLPHTPLPETGSVAPLGKGSLIDLIVQYSDNMPSPRRFRLWTAIHAVGAAVERRVWMSSGGMQMYPNIYIMLVGPPGTGKSVAIDPVTYLLRKSGAASIAPTDVTKQSLLDSLALTTKAVTSADGHMFDYHFLALCITELSSFMGKYDTELAGLLTLLFDCPDMSEEKKRSHDKGKSIPFPGLSFIIGTATKNLGATLTDELWGSGFMARVILVYSAEVMMPPSADAMFDAPVRRDIIGEEIVERFKTLGKFVGQVNWTQPAREALWAFRVTQSDGAPIHNRLENYVTRRWLHLAKLCMIHALAHERMDILLVDVESALSWLEEAEALMPEIFKDMVGHEDGQIFEELRAALFQLHMKSTKPLPVAWIYKFLAQRVSTHSVPRIIEVAEAAEYIVRVAGTSGEDALYLPGKMTGPKNIGVI